MRRIAGLALALGLLCGGSAFAQSVTYDFEDGTDQGFGTGFGNDASASWPIENVGGSNRMRVTGSSFQAAGREEGNPASPFYLAMSAASANEALYQISYDWYVDTALNGGTYLQMGTYVNTGSGYYAQDFPNTGKDVELDSVALASGGAFSGTVTETFSAKGFDIPLAETFFRLGLIINGDGNKIVHFDNISVSLVPEPASAALLGLAVPLLRFTRRRGK